MLEALNFTSICSPETKGKRRKQTHPATPATPLTGAEGCGVLPCAVTAPAALGGGGRLPRCPACTGRCGAVRRPRTPPAADGAARGRGGGCPCRFPCRAPAGRRAVQLPVSVAALGRRAGVGLRRSGCGGAGSPLPKCTPPWVVPGCGGVPCAPSPPVSVCAAFRGRGWRSRWEWTRSPFREEKSLCGAEGWEAERCELGLS